MRCRMRCGDIWRCGGPIKKYVPVDSIGIEGRTQEMTFDSQVPPYSVTYSISISPSDATKKDVRIESNNPSIISVDSVESDQVTFTIHNEGDARVRITSLADADISDEYSVSVVTPSEQFAPNNGIFVDVDTEGTATGKKRKTKATAMGDRFTARVFMLKEESEDYVLLEWTHGGDVSKTYVGATNEAYTRAMFTEEVTDKIAREIETLWDNGQIENRFVKFTDETWSMIEQFYNEPLTPEAVEALQEVLVNNEIVTPERCPASIQAVWGNDTTIEVGQTAAVITNFTTTAECENVDYSNIVAYVRASYNVPSDVATASIDFNENKVYVTGVKAGECTVMFTDGDHSWSNNVTVTEPAPPAVQSIEDFSDAYVLYGETMNLYVDILPLDASYSTADFNLIFKDGSGNVVQNPPVTADVVSIHNVEGHVVGIGIEVIGGQTAGDVYMTVEYTPSQGAISGGGWVHVGPAATTLSDIMPLQIRVGEYGSYRIGGLTPSDALTKGITVTSSDDSVVSVGSLYNDLGSLLVDLEGLSTGEVTLTITLTNGAEYEKTVIVIEPSYTFTINVENLPEGANIHGEYRDSHTGELLEEISASSFPVEFEMGVYLEGDLTEGYCHMEFSADTSYGRIEFSCNGYKLLLEPVGFDLEDEGGGAFVVSTDGDWDFDASLTISFTPME